MSIINTAPRLTETITVKRPTAHSAFGDATLGTTFTTPARVERSSSDVAADSGRGDAEATQVLARVELRLGDFVFLPEDDTADVSTGRRIVNVARVVALDGTVLHWVATC